VDWNCNADNLCYANGHWQLYGGLNMNNPYEAKANPFILILVS